jgi:glycosyltransferase involved in cell wall biosynthesis
MSKRVLIVSFSMPPSPDIGVRRWVKFAKYLKQKGNLVKIIAAHEYFPETSPWLRDAESLKGDLEFTRSGYPRHLGIRPQSLAEKISYRLSLHYAKLRSRGNYYDKSNLWKSRLLKAARKTIREHDIHNVICTIPPFKIAHHLLELKKEFPKLNFIVDYRDPWTNNKTAFGFMGLPPERFQAEHLAEQKVVQQYDKITAVSAEMKAHFKTFLKDEELNRKFVTLPNGFDPEDFYRQKRNSSPDRKTSITIIFAGTFYDRSVHVLEKLMKTVEALEEQEPVKKGFLKFVFIGSMPQQAKALIDAHEPSFTFQGKKNLAEAYELLADADYCSLFLTDDLNYSLSTKFYEYLAMQKPILSFSKEKGANARFIEEKKIGLGIDFLTMSDVIARLMKGQPILEFAPQLDIEEFSVKKLTDKVEQLLI